MAEEFIIDTSAVIKYLNETFPASGISFLDKVLAELHRGEKDGKTWYRSSECGVQNVQMV